MLGPEFFFEKLKSVRSLAAVQDVRVEVAEDEEDDTNMWPFADRVYTFTSGTAKEVAQWAAALQPDEIEEGFASGEPESAPDLNPGFKCYGLWCD